MSSRGVLRIAAAHEADVGLARRFFAVLLGLLTLLFFFTWNQPILEQHGFRQTQTAITSYWMIHEGYGLFNYITPVLGDPWAIPFELPWYQWIVAKISIHTGLGLEPIGRLVSFLFSLATLGVTARILRLVGLANLGVWSFAIIFLACPQYAFWGRTFMIETAALFFSMTFLWAALELARSKGLATFGWAGLAIFAGVLGGTQKVTTFLPVWAAVGVFLAVRMVSAFRERSDSSVRFAVVVCTVLFIPALCATLWSVYADSVKELNPVGRNLTSVALATWNFGTLEQRLSPKLWYDVIWMRGIDSGVMSRWVLFGLALVSLAVLRGRAIWLFLATLAMFLAPFLIFTNLHMIHNYYQTANAIFLLAAVAIVIDSVRTRTSSVIAYGCLIVVVAAEIWGYGTGYLLRQTQPLETNAQRELQLAAVVRESVPPERAILTIGLDWSSAVPYYSERKAMSGWYMDVPKVLAMYRDSAAFADLGGVVLCPTDKESLERSLSEGLDRVVAGWQSVAVGDCLVFAKPATDKGL